MSKFKLGDKVMTPKGEMTIQITMYDPKKKTTKYSVIGNNPWFAEEECTLIKRKE